MEFSLSPAQQSLRDEVAQFAKTELSAGAAARDRDQLFPRDLWQLCGKLRLQGLPVPEELGGRGLDSLSVAIALESLGYGCSDGGLSFSICAHLLACVVPVWKHATDAQKALFFPQLCDGSLVAANAMTEPGSGSDAFAMSTRAEPAEDGFVLNGTKTFCTNAPVADLILTYAMTDSAKGYHGGVTAFIVRTNSRGCRTGPAFSKLGLRSSPMSEVIFENVRVTPDCVLGRVGGGAAIFAQSMEWERTCLGAIHVGAMQRLLELTVRFARTHRVDGEAIGKSQGVAHRIADMKVQLEASRLLTYHAAWRLDRRDASGLDASIAKLHVSESHVAAAEAAVRTLQIEGVLGECEAQRALRDSLAGTIYSGTSEVQRNLIARWLGL